MISLHKQIASRAVSRALLLGGASLLAAAGSSAQAQNNSAQTNTPPNNSTPISNSSSPAEPAAPAPAPSAADTTAAAAAAAARAPNAEDVIVVTGSRIRQNGFQSPTPVTVLGAADLATKAPTSIPDAINQLPQFVNSGGPNRSEVRFNVVPVLGNFLNLRGLGTRRTLILLDGVRVPPTSFDGSVSVDTLPQLLVQRVDVVTGGASAAYGSDALIGVVNFVLDKKFSGIKAVAQSGLSTYGDAFSYRVGLAGGVSLMNDRLHVIGSAERFDSHGIRNRDRPLGGKSYCTIGTGTAASPFTIVPNCRYNTASNGGKTVGGGNLNNMVFLPDGSLKPFNPGTAGGVGGDGGRFPTSLHITVPLTTTQGFGRVSFDVTPDLMLFAQAAYTEDKSSDVETVINGHYSGTNTAITIFADNAYLPAAARALLTTPSFQLSVFGDPDVTEHLGKAGFENQISNQRVRTLNFITGVEGKFGNDWTWNLNYVHGDSRFRTRNRESETLKLYAAVDAVRDTSGNIVCRVSITNPGLYPGCVPLNLFGQGNANQAAIDYVYGISKLDTRNKLDVGAANLNGTLFDLPYGPLSFSVGAEYRRQTLKQVTNADPSIPLDPTGIRGVLPGAVRFNLTNGARALGSVKVKEGYVEAVAPLLKNLPGAVLLDLNAAVRYTDYSTSGAVKTWKVGFNYKPIESVRFRGTISRDIRAPSLYELFAGPSNSITTLADPRTNVTSTITTSVRSNAALTPEKGLTKIVGVVFQPTFLPGFGMSIDAYDIDISDAIVAATAVANVQSCEQSGGTAASCALVTRPLPFSDRSPANFPTLVLSQPLNLATLRQRGLDIEAGYRFALSNISGGWAGTLDIRGFANYVPTLNQRQAPGAAVQHYAGYLYNSKWRGSVSVTYTGERLTVNLQERFTGSYKLPAFEGAAVYAAFGKAPNIGYTDATVSYAPLEGKKAELFVTVNNLFNAKPPLINAPTLGDLQYPTVKSTYDVVGRYITGGVRLRF